MHFAINHWCDFVTRRKSFNPNEKHGNAVFWCRDAMPVFINAH